MSEEVKNTFTRPANVGEVVQFCWQLLVKSAGLKPSHDYGVQLVRSLVVSGIAVIANFLGSYVLKEKLGVYYLLSAAGSFLLGVLVNHYLSTYWVFASRKLTSKRAELLVSIAVMGAGLLFNLIIIAGLVELLKLNYWIALSTSTVVVFFWNFIIRKKILY